MGTTSPIADRQMSDLFLCSVFQPLALWDRGLSYRSMEVAVSVDGLTSEISRIE